MSFWRVPYWKAGGTEPSIQKNNPPHICGWTLVDSQIPQGLLPTDRMWKKSRKTENLSLCTIWMLSFTHGLKWSINKQHAFKSRTIFWLCLNSQHWDTPCFTWANCGVLSAHGPHSAPRRHCAVLAQSWPSPGPLLKAAPHSTSLVIKHH